MTHIRKILPRLTNQTIQFVGDSLVANQFVSLACLLWEADKSITTRDIVLPPGLPVKAPERYTKSIRSFAIRSNTYHLEIQFLFASTLLNVHVKQLGRISESTISQEVLDHEWESVVQGRFEPFIRTPTIIIFSAGHHFDTRKYNLTHSHRVDLPLLRLVFDRVNQLLSDIQQTNKTNFRLIMRSAPPRHYSQGEWNSGGTCNDELPLSKESVKAKIAARDNHYTVPLDIASVMKEITSKWNIEFLDILPQAMTRSDAMVGFTPTGFHGAISDCSHYCVPGIPDMWNSMLLEHLAPENSTSR